MKIIERLRSIYCLLMLAFLSKMDPKTRSFFCRRGTVMALVVGLISLAVIIVVGVMVVFNLQTTMGAMDLGVSGNATREAIFTNVGTAFSLVTIVPIIAAAGLIITIVVAYLGGGKT